MWRDVRFAVRSCIASPVLSITTTLTLAVATAAAAAVLTLLNAVVFKPLPVDRPRELVLFSGETGDGVYTGTQQGTWILFSTPSFDYLRSHQQAFQDVAAFQAGRERVAARAGSDEPELTYLTRVSGNYFSVLGVRAQIGRMLTPADDTRGAPRAVVLSEAYWTRRFARDPAIVGRTLTLGDTPYSIVGVAAAGFHGETMRTPPDAWTPVAAQQASPGTGRDEQRTYWLIPIGRLKPGVTLTEANAEMNARLRTFLEDEAGTALTAERRGEIAHTSLALVRGDQGRSALRSRATAPLTLLAVLVALVLVAAAINVASLLTARAASRDRTTAVHLMLGAGRTRLLRRALLDTCCFVVPGAALGLAAARANAGLLLPLLTVTPLPIDLRPDGRLILMLSAALVGAFGLASLGPIRSVWTAASGDGLFRRGETRLPRTGRVLVAAQVALAVPLLLVAGLLLRSVERLEGQDLAVHRGRVLLADFGPPMGAADRGAAARADILDAVRAHPAVASATFASQTPLGGERHASSLLVEGRPPRDDRSAVAAFVGPGYFRTLGIPLVAGRDFTETDDAAHPNVIILSETAARTFLPGEQALGQRIAYGSRRPALVIGIAKDVKFGSLRAAAPRQAFLPQLQNGAIGGRLVIQTVGDPLEAAVSLRDTIRRAAPILPLVTLGTLDAEIRAATTTERALAVTATLLAVATLAVCGLGLFGLMAYIVARRAREIGIRMALGASPRAVRTRILSDALRITVVGAIVGGAAAFATARVVRSQLYEIDAADPMVLAGASVLIFGVAAAAALWPAGRASSVDPLIALRSE